MLRKLNLAISEKRGILNEFREKLPQDIIRHNDWRIVKSKLTNGLVLEKAFYKTNIFSDNIHFIEKFLSKLYDREYNSILCGGLGLGIAPYMCQSFCDVVDVVEIDADLIHLINTVGHLTSKVNVICDDFFTYEPQQKYDVILVDIWQNELGDFYKEVDIIVEKYFPYLNDGGLLFLPLVDLLQRDEAPCNC